MRNATLSSALLSVLVVVGACGEVAEPTTVVPNGAGPSYIVNGTPTGSAYRNVGALIIDFDNDGFVDATCSGTLISATVFLTAAHCVSDPAATNQRLYVTFASDLSNTDPLNATIAATGWQADPGFSEMTLDHDLAVAFLPAGSTTGITPAMLPTAGRLDQMSASGTLKKALFVNVGYGVTTTKKTKGTFSFDGVRRSSESQFKALSPIWLKLVMRPGLGNDCYGDSGGPKFLAGDATTIYATVSSGDANCLKTSIDYRLDTPNARAFLGQYVVLP